MKKIVVLIIAIAGVWGFNQSGMSMDDVTNMLKMPDLEQPEAVLRVPKLRQVAMARGAQSALAANPADASELWSVHDGFYDKTRLFKININKAPFEVTEEVLLHDTFSVLASHIDRTEIGKQLLNDDTTVNLDVEGLAKTPISFWIVSEGEVKKRKKKRRIKSNNLLLKTTLQGDIVKVVGLPARLNKVQSGYGFEGVAAVMDGDVETVYVVFQREWDKADDPEGLVRIGRYQEGEWTFVYYPIDDSGAEKGSWVGLSEISTADGKAFYVVERSNKGESEKAVKRLYQIDFTGVAFKSDDETPALDVVNKLLIKDLVPVIDVVEGSIAGKVEGLAVFDNGKVIFSLDNDGAEAAAGQTQMIETYLQD